jgi:hypothetical protein
MSGLNIMDKVWHRYSIALLTLVFSVVGIFFAGLAAISAKKEDAMLIFHIVLPIFASWIGIVLAYYFTKENSDATNTYVREIIAKLSPDEIAKKPVTTIMRQCIDTEMVYFKIENGKTDSSISLGEIRKKISEKSSRLPILNPDGSPRYIIHGSRIETYLLSSPGHSNDDTLAQFIEDRKGAGIEFGHNKGFVIVSEKAIISEAKELLECCPKCQDIFVTRGGTEVEPLLGWISNLRLLKFLHG